MCNTNSVPYEGIADLSIAMARSRALVDWWTELDRIKGTNLSADELHKLYVNVWQLRRILNKTLAHLTEARLKMGSKGCPPSQVIGEIEL